MTPLLADHETETRKSETIMNEWVRPCIHETQAGMEVTSYLPAELDFA